MQVSILSTQTQFQFDIKLPFPKKTEGPTAVEFVEIYGLKFSWSRAICLCVVPEL